MSPEVIEEFTIDRNASSVVRQERKSFLAQQYVNGNCKICGWKSRVHYGNPFNWVRHLKSKHVVYEYEMSVYTKYKENLVKSSSVKKRDRSPDSCYLPFSKRLHQEKIEISGSSNDFKKERTKKKDSKLPSEVQDRINQRIFEYLVADGRPRPLSTVCLTANIWGSNKRRFMGITAHWLVTENNGKIDRKSAGVAWKRFEGTHTNDKIAKMIDSVLDEFSRNESPSNSHR